MDHRIVCISFVFRVGSILRQLMSFVNTVQYVNTLMMMNYSIGYGNVADMYVELNNQLAIHDALALCCTDFDM